MTCVDPTPGVVTDPTGAIGGDPADGLVDCFAKHNPETYEVAVQYFVELSSVAGAAGRYRLNQTKAGERWLLLIYEAGHTNDPLNANPVDHREGTYTVGQPVYTEGSATTTPNTFHVVNANFLWHDDRCRQSSTGIQGWSGTVALTRADEDALEGSYDLTRGADRIAGTFAAPRVPMDGCPARPSKVACV